MSNELLLYFISGHFACALIMMTIILHLIILILKYKVLSKRYIDMPSLILISSSFISFIWLIHFTNWFILLSSFWFQVQLPKLDSRVSKKLSLEHFFLIVTWKKKGVCVCVCVCLMVVCMMGWWGCNAWKRCIAFVHRSIGMFTLTSLKTDAKLSTENVSLCDIRLALLYLKKLFSFFVR